MKYSDYSKIVVFIEARSTARKAKLRDLHRKNSYAFRRKALFFSLCNQTHYRFGKAALHDVTAASTLQDLHEIQLEHQGDSIRLKRIASSILYLTSLRNPRSRRQRCLQRLLSSPSDHDRRRIDEAP